MRKSLKNVEDVAASHLCMGCGACAGLYPKHVRMVETQSHARRPECKTDESRGGPLAQRMLKVCPGVEIDYSSGRKVHGTSPDLIDEWGPVLEVWEGHAVDPELRFRGSSGGMVNALALYAIEQERMEGVLHVKARTDVPYLNESTISSTRDELLSGSGSRYAPSSPCDRLSDVEAANAPLVFIGKPCDVAAVQRARQQRPELDKKIGLTIGIFCAGVPSLSATFDLMRELGANEPGNVKELRYRGRGWPGRMEVVTAGHGGTTHRESVTYGEGWGDILQKKRQWRCHVCADHTGELADLSVGDPWYRPVTPGEKGRSLLVVRTERGRKLVRAALAAGYVAAERRDLSKLPDSQPNLLRVRGSIWGRVLTLLFTGAAYPRYPGLKLFSAWWNRLNNREKVQSFYGTLVRVFRKRLISAERWQPFEVNTGCANPAALSEPGKR